MYYIYIYIYNTLVLEYEPYIIHLVGVEYSYLQTKYILLARRVVIFSSISTSSTKY